MPYKFRPGVVHIEDNLGNSTNIMGLLSDSNGTSSNCNCGSISNSYITQICITHILLKNKISLGNKKSILWNEVLK